MKEYISALTEVCFASSEVVSEIRFRAYRDCVVADVYSHDGRQEANSKHWTKANAESGHDTGWNLVRALMQ